CFSYFTYLTLRTANTKFTILCKKTQHIFRVRFLRYITKYIKFSVYIANLTSLKDDPEIYNQLMFFKSLPK
ncbi:unnamed protein product, partial [Tenebrio molitor]